MTKKYALIVTGVWQGGDGQHAPAAQLPSCLYRQLPVCLHPYAAQRCHHVCRLPCSVSPKRSVAPPPCLWPPAHLACCCLLPCMLCCHVEADDSLHPSMHGSGWHAASLVFASLPACQRARAPPNYTTQTSLHHFCSLQHCACESCMH